VSILSLRGDTAIVTGGANGIGAAVVAGLQAQGVRVASIDRQPGASADVVVEGDVADEASLDAAFAEALDGLGGRCHYAFANAGVSGVGSILTMPAAEWDRVHAVNLRGVFLTLQRAARAIRATGEGGSIVLTASTAGITPDIALSHYATSKIAVRHLAAIAAHELGHLGIRVNAVAPGLTETSMTARVRDLPGFVAATEAHTPLGRLGRPDDIAEAVLALFALEWVTGQTLVADGGFSLLGTAEVPGITPATLADFGI